MSTSNELWCGYKTVNQNPQLNPCCFLMYVKFYQTGFWSGQRKTDFEEYQTFTNPICRCFFFGASLVPSFEWKWDVLSWKNESEIFHLLQEHYLSNIDVVIYLLFFCITIYYIYTGFGFRQKWFNKNALKS